MEPTGKQRKKPAEPVFLGNNELNENGYESKQKGLIMRRTVVFGALAAVVLVAFAFVIFPNFMAEAEEMAMPFGGEEDVKFAEALWEAIKGYPDWLLKTDVIKGNTPHGAFVRIYYNVVTVDGKPYHVINKDNFMGKDAEGKEVEIETVAKSPEKYLAAATAMVQREAGYDPDNNNWFWVKYGADGSIAKNDKEMSLAGRVAKGMDMGCIACHKGAKDGDYIFINDGDM